MPLAPIPFILIPDEDEDDPEVLALVYPDLSPDDPIIARVKTVLETHDPGDGLEQRLDDSESTNDLISRLVDWRILSPDDPKGEVLQARVPAAIANKMDHLIARTRGEVWATRSDFVREGIWQYIRSVLLALEANDPVLASILAESELGGRASFHATRRKRLEKAITDTRDYLTDLANLDDHEEAHRFLLDLALRIRAIKVDSWRQHWLLALNSLPLMQITARMLDLSGWSLPQEFLPAAGKAPAIVPAPGTPSPGTGVVAPP